jgi:hypothetical protein
MAAGPAFPFLVQLLVCSAVFLLSKTSVRVVFVPALYFACLPYVTSAAWCTGGEPWRYQLLDFIVVSGGLFLVVFVVYCCRELLRSKN